MIKRLIGICFCLMLIMLGAFCLTAAAAGESAQESVTEEIIAEEIDEDIPVIDIGSDSDNELHKQFELRKDSHNNLNIIWRHNNSVYTIGLGLCVFLAATIVFSITIFTVVLVKYIKHIKNCWIISEDKFDEK